MLLSQKIRNSIVMLLCKKPNTVILKGLLKITFRPRSALQELLFATG